VIQNPAAAAQHQSCNLNYFIRQMGHALLEHIKDTCRILANVCKQSLQIIGGHWFWRECLIVRR